MLNKEREGGDVFFFFVRGYVGLFKVVMIIGLSPLPPGL